MADSISSVSPVDGSVVAKRAVASKKQVAATFAAARAAQKDWANLSIKERAAYCSKAVDAMLAIARGTSSITSAHSCAALLPTFQPTDHPSVSTFRPHCVEMSNRPME